MNISAPFVQRPIATTLLAVAVLLAGLTAFSFLPVAPLPRVDMPTIQISANLPGASPETMASAVATPLERRFGRIAGVTEITSTSGVGSTNITLQFDLDRDVDSAARDVQAAIVAAGGELPTGMPSRPTYRKVNPADAPILIVSMTSTSVPLAQIFDSANTILAQKIAQIRGVGQVFVGGGQQPAIRIQVDPAALAGAGMSLEDVRSTVVGATVDMPTGSLSGDRHSQIVSTDDQLFGARAFEALTLTAPPATTTTATPPSPVGTGTLRLGDVATVLDDVENSRVAAWVNGTRAVLMIIRKQPGANILETITRVKAILPGLAAAISPGVNIEVALDRSQSIRGSVAEVERSLVISVVLVVLVVFVFLRSVRATAVPSVAVPLSLIGTFGVMYMLDYSLDNLSLMALTISTGFVVDDAIVVTENVARLIEKGMSPHEAALEGAKQIGFTIISITVSLLAVFIPLLLMGGIVGRLFREFAVTLSVAIAVSAVVSLTLTPMMCAKLLTHDSGNHGRLYKLSERGFDAILHAYEKALSWVLRHRRIAQFATLVTLGVTIALFFVVPKGLFPQQDAGMLIGFSEAGQDVSFESMRTKQERVNAVVQADPDVAHAISFIGGGPGGSGNTGSVFIDLKAKPGRQASADEIVGRLRPKLARIEGVNLFLQAVQDVRIGGRSARTQYQYTLQSADLTELRTWAPRVLDQLKKLPMLKDVTTDQQTSGLQLDFTFDRDTASRLGITPQMIDDTLYDAFGQRQIATRFTQLNQYRVVMEVLPSAKSGPESLAGIYVKSTSGDLVPLGALGNVSTSSTPLSINHQGQFPSITLSFNLAPGASLGPAIEQIHKAELAIGMPGSVRATFQGTAQAFQASLESEPYLVMAALITVYIVLGMLYESLIHPITILSTLPSAGLGALLALLFCGTELGIIALIGMILLIGIVKKNAILMIDFAIEAERDEGLSPEEAITKACLLRFRPILMTTLAALLGGLPLALGNGMGAELRRPLGIAIVGGLLLSQVMTLFTTPITYLALDRFTKARRSHRATTPPAAPQTTAEPAT